MTESEDIRRARDLMMAVLDGESSDVERQELERLVDQNPALGDEWHRLSRVKEGTATMAFQEPPGETWDRYWASVYNRAERKLAWLLVGLGATVLLAYGLWNAVPEIVQGLFGESDLPVVVRAGIVAVMTGAVLLIVSVVREQLSSKRTDSYDKGVSR